MSDYIVPILFLTISLLPPAVDDLLDYYVYDFMWFPTLPLIIYSLSTFLNELLMILPLHLIYLLIWIFLHRRGELGGADLILYTIYFFYAPIVPLLNPLFTYGGLILFTNIYALISYPFRDGLGTPLVSMAPPAILTYIPLLYTLTGF